MDPNLTSFGTILGPFWGPFWDPKVVQKETKNETTFGTPRLRLISVHIMPERELNESGEKGTVTGIIFSKRKGGILGYWNPSWGVLKAIFGYLNTS